TVLRFTRWRREIVVKNHVVDVQGVHSRGDGAISPSPKFAFPVVFSAAGDADIDTGHELLHVAIAKCSQYLIFRFEVQVKSAFGDLGAGRDLLDGRRRYAMLKKKGQRGIHQLLTPGLCRSGALNLPG